MNIIDPISKLFGEWSASTTLGSIFVKLGFALVFSAIIGCERASKRHSAGLRTFMMITLASTFAGMLDLFLIESFGITFVTISAACIIAFAIISTNSILFTSKNQIRGLTTSATLWTCGILGLCLGLGFYTITTLGFVISLCCLSLFPKLEKFLKNRSNHFEIFLELANKSSLSEFVVVVRKLGLRIDDIELNTAYVNSGLSVYSISLTVVSPELKKYKTHSEIISAISSLEYVKHIEEMA